MRLSNELVACIQCTIEMQMTSLPYVALSSAFDSGNHIFLKMNFLIRGENCASILTQMILLIRTLLQLILQTVFRTGVKFAEFHDIL
uniref:Uncharacterized protein n=1 Tax=Pararge aegeria TaxID=116150 RepID=S4NMZ9_9NEOP